ncbi:MAG: hypothetical protein ACE5G7_04630 [Candidatus Hydrothermarchaeaceae archaeon]
MAHRNEDRRRETKSLTMNAGARRMGKLRPMGSYGSYCAIAIDDRKANQGAEHELVQHAGFVAGALSLFKRVLGASVGTDPAVTSSVRE